MNEIKIGLIGGSGLGAAMAQQTDGRRHYIETPFGKPSDAIIESNWNGIPILFLNRHGAGHLLNPTSVPYRANIFALKMLGCTHILASGAVGSLREEYKPRDLVIPDQVIDRTHKRPNTFYENAAVHVEFAEPFCPVLRRIVLDAAKEQEQGETGEQDAVGTAATKPSDLTPTVHERGCYVCMEGPAFSSRAESLMHRLWGGDLIGMTAMPEAKLAKEAEIPYALIALVTDYDSWRPHAAVAGAAGSTTTAPPEPPDPFALLKEIIGNLESASNNAIHLMRKTVNLMASRIDELKHCPAQHALQLGIWSDKGWIAPEEKARLAPLWGRYLET